MTYTVKNGTWCKDNEGEYLSTTMTGLRAMRKADQVPDRTRVVIHEPRQPAGTLIDSLSPTPPEGFMVPDGSAFDTDIYTDLLALFPDGKLPDLRECVLVMAGQRSEGVTNHDVYDAGQFKDDQFAEHTHSITDPGHTHFILYDMRDQDGHGSPCASFDSDPDSTKSTAPTKTNIVINSIGASDKVTHGKQYGVYRYIAF